MGVWISVVSGQSFFLTLYGLHTDQQGSMGSGSLGLACSGGSRFQ